jgi:single-stranded-DNA-specific exonuclease
VEQIVADCESTAIDRERTALVFSGSGWHPGVLGIVASRLVERFWRPVFVLSDVAGRAQGLSGTLSGSGRSIPAFHLLEALESMPELFDKFGGHKQAAGLTLSENSLAEFRDRFHGVAARKLTEDDLCPQYTVDAIASLSEFTDRVVESILELGPFGFGNAAPLFFATDVEVAGPPRVLREGKHYSVPLRQNGRTLWCKAWNFGQRAAELASGERVEVLFQIEDDPASRKRGYGPWCVTLKDIRAMKERP